MPRKKEEASTSKGTTKKTTRKIASAESKKSASMDDGLQDGKIYCANCRYCILLRKPTGTDNSHYLLRVKCSKEMWKKKLGEEKVYKYFTVARRTVSECPEYKEMGELKTFLRTLRKSLPVRDEIYTYKK